MLRTRPSLLFCLLASWSVTACKSSATIIDETDLDTDEIVETDTDTDTDSDTDADTDTDTNGPGTGAGDTVGTPDPGSGAAVGAYEVDALAEGSDTFIGSYRFFETLLDVQVDDDAGDPVSGAIVTVETTAFGPVALIEDLPNNPGRYRADAFGYDRTYELTIDGPAGRFEAVAVGPGIHAIAVGSTPVDVASDWTLQWFPSGASGAEVNTRGMGNVTTDDDGEYTVPAGDIDYQLAEQGEERARVRRWETLDLTGALPGSSFRVEIEVQENDVDTDDSRTGRSEGDIELDPDLGDLTGMVHVLAWPSDLDGYVGPAWAHTSVANFPTNDTYLLAPLAPGDWLLLAYLDLDDSDSGLTVPAGPSDGEPFEEREITVGPDGTVTRSLFLADGW